MSSTPPSLPVLCRLHRSRTSGPEHRVSNPPQSTQYPVYSCLSKWYEETGNHLIERQLLFVVWGKEHNHLQHITVRNILHGDYASKLSCGPLSSMAAFHGNTYKIKCWWALVGNWQLYYRPWLEIGPKFSRLHLAFLRVTFVVKELTETSGLGTEKLNNRLCVTKSLIRNLCGPLQLNVHEEFDRGINHPC